MAFLLFSAILAIFRRLHYHYWRLLRPFSSSCIYIIFGSLAIFRRLHLLLLSAVLAIFGRLQFIVSGCVAFFFLGVYFFFSVFVSLLPRPYGSMV